MKWLKKILGRGPKLPEPTGRTHDFSRGNSWGWAFYVDEVTGLTIKGHGFGPRIREGDWVVLRNKEGGKPRYLVVTIEFMRDPNDMFFYTAVFAPPSPSDPEPPKPTLADELIF